MLQRVSGRTIAIILLTIAGVGLCALMRAFADQTPWVTLLIPGAIAAAFSAMPSAWLAAAGRRIAAPSPRQSRLRFWGVFAVAAGYLAVTALLQARDLYPRVQDELNYAVGARLLAHGRLWEPAHPLADFFETFFLIVRPVYVPCYFPGPTLLFAVGAILGLKSWVVPLLLAGLTVALAYRVASMVAGEGAGLLAALLLLANSAVRLFSTMVMSQIPMALLGLLMIWSWLHWRHSRRWIWVVLLGLFAGWAADTRPVDALAFAAPIGLAMIGSLAKAGARAIAATAGLLALGALPFIALQAFIDVGVNGRAGQTPYVRYLAVDQPGTEFGYLPGAGFKRPDLLQSPRKLETRLPQKQIYYHDMVAEEAGSRSHGLIPWLLDRGFVTLFEALPTVTQEDARAGIPASGGPLLLMLPLALMALRQGKRWSSPAALLLAIALLMFGLYLFNWFFLAHYMLPIIAIGAVLIGSVATMWSVASRRVIERFMALFLPMGVAALCVMALPELNGLHDETKMPVMSAVQETLAKIDSPAVVFFRFTPGCSVHEEPVYNIDAAWPDDAHIVRVQDLGARDLEVVDYYAARQPERSYFIFDRASGELTPLGNARQAEAYFRAKAAQSPGVVQPAQR